MELGRRMGGWWLGGSEGGCRQDQRAVLVRAFEGRWRSGIEGAARENGAREGRVVVHAERPRGSGWRARGGSNGADGPEGRDGWRCYVGGGDNEQI